MRSRDEHTLASAIRVALRGARDLGTWDTPWHAYSPTGWEARVANAPRPFVRRVARDMFLEEHLGRIVAEFLSQRQQRKEVSE